MEEESDWKTVIPGAGCGSGGCREEELDNWKVESPVRFLGMLGKTTLSVASDLRSAFLGAPAKGK